METHLDRELEKASVLEAVCDGNIFWGTRGSIATLPDTVRYGGNTTCVIRDGDEFILLMRYGDP